MGRAKSEFVVLEVKEPGLYEQRQGGLTSTDEARKWLKKNAEPIKKYRIAAFRGSLVTVEVTPITRRKLLDVRPSPMKPAQKPVDSPDPKD